MGAAIAVIAALVLMAACGPTDSPRSRLAKAKKDCTVDLVGDSLGVGAFKYGQLADKLEAEGCELRNADTASGRRPEQGAAIVEEWAEDGELSESLVVVLGTNDCRNEAAMIRAVDRIRTAVGADRPIVWVNTWMYEGCDDVVNQVLTDTFLEEDGSRADHGRLWIVDHWTWMEETPERSGDGVHIGRNAYLEYAERIVDMFTDGYP